jgi:hypothetical protein
MFYKQKNWSIIIFQAKGFDAAVVKYGLHSDTMLTRTCTDRSVKKY